MKTEIYRKYSPKLLFAIALLILTIQGWVQILSGRLWAEEAGLYLQQAIDTDHPVSTLLSPALGYYSLISRMSASILSILPINWVGYASIVISLGLLLLVWVTVAQHRRKKPLGFLGAAFAPVSILLANGELLANTLLLSYWYAAAAAVLLIFNGVDADATEEEIGVDFLTGLVLILSALSGPHALFILFAGAFFQLSLGRLGQWTRSKAVRLYVVFALIQLAFIIYSLWSGSYQTGNAQGGHRFAGGTIASVGLALIKYNVVFPFFGYTLLDKPLSLSAVGILFVLICWGLIIRGGDRVTRSLMWISLLLQLLYLIASIGVSGGVRYAFVPNILLMLVLVRSVISSQIENTAKYAAAALLICAAGSPFLDHAVRITKFAKPEWPSFQKSLIQTCEKFKDGQPIQCIKAWPVGETDWQVCIHDVTLRSACQASQGNLH